MDESPPFDDLFGDIDNLDFPDDPKLFPDSDLFDYDSLEPDSICESGVVTCASWGDSDHNQMEYEFADYKLSGGTDAPTTPMSYDSSSLSDEEDTAVVSSSILKGVASGKTVRARRSAPAPTRSGEDSPTPISYSVPSDSEAQYVAVESSGVPTVSSSSGRPNVKIVKVIKPRDNRDTTTDVLKAINEKNQKNAQLARDNRAKKKQYVEGLENQVKELSQNQACLMKKMEEMEKTIQELTADKKNLQSVIANASPLAGLIQNIQGAQFHANIGSHKRGSEAVEDHDYSSPHKKSKSSSSGGVCLHVTPDQVSLEFCSKCAQKSAQVD